MAFDVTSAKIEQDTGFNPSTATLDVDTPEQNIGQTADNTRLTGGVQVNVPKDILKSAVSALSEFSAGGAFALAKLLSGGQFKQDIGDFQREIGRIREMDALESNGQFNPFLSIAGTVGYEPQSTQGSVSKFLTSMLPYVFTKGGSWQANTLNPAAVEGIRAFGEEDNNPLLSSALAALTGRIGHNLIPALTKLPGRAVNWLAGIDENVANRATNPLSKTLSLSKSKEAPFAIQDAWDELLGNIRTGTENLKSATGRAVGNAKTEGIQSTRSIMNVPGVLPTNKYTGVLDDIVANRPPNTKISVKERELNKQVIDYLEKRQYMRAEEIQAQMDLIDADFIKWNKAGGASQSKSEQDAVRAAKKIRELMNEDLKSMYPDTYKDAKNQYSDLMDLLTEESMPTLLEGKGRQAINLLRSIESPSQGVTRQALQDLESRTGTSIVEPSRDILAGEQLSRIFGNIAAGEPDKGKFMRSIPLMYAENIGLPTGRFLNQYLPNNPLDELLRFGTIRGGDTILNELLKGN